LGYIEINQDKFEKGVDDKYVWRPFSEKNIISNSMDAARDRKVNKYEEIIKKARM
jgi:hypothetical protein